MDTLSLPIKLLLAILLGGLIGLERESASSENKEKDFSGDKWGLRTYSLISLLGAIAGFLYLFGNTQLSIIITVSFFILIFIYYSVGSWMIKSMGLTTELGAVFSFLIGYFVTSEIFPLQLVIAITVVIDLILSMKEKSRIFMLGLKRSEIDAFIGFAIIALVILPFLPNKGFFLTDIHSIKELIVAYGGNIGILENLEIINPFKLWFIVALITGIDVLGYVLSKAAGTNKGIVISSAVGGLISSTSVTQALALKSKSGNNVNELVKAAIVSNMASFIPIFILIAPLNAVWLIEVTPVLLFLITAALLSALFFHFTDKKDAEQINSLSEQEKENITEERIFSLMPALRFAIILILVRVITKSALILFGESGFLISSIGASLTGIDAVIINLAEMAGKTISHQYALVTLLAVNATNLISKTAYAAVQGNRKFTLKFALAALFIIICSFGGYFLIF